MKLNSSPSFPVWAENQNAEEVHQSCAGLLVFAAWPILIVAAVLAGCSSTPRTAPVVERLATPVPATARSQTLGSGDWRPEYYTVRRGDTLYAVALDYGLDYRELAAWNGLEDPNRIRVGQRLRLAAGPQQGVTTAPVGMTPALQGKPLEGSAEQASAPTPDKTKAETKPASELGKSPDGSLQGDGEPDWIWPTGGRVIAGYSESAQLKGLDIAGSPGQPVVAGATGKVVYSGTGLRGYGKLVIVKHNAVYLSAYAHNRDILVKEGQTVAKGQKIAEMGNTDADQVKLHFQIRRYGKPVDPLKYLPGSPTS